MVEKEVELADGNKHTLPGVEFTRVSPHLEMGYPCELTIHSSYLLSPNDELVLIHEASISGSDGLITPINLVNHAYWNLSGDFKQSTIADHDLRLNCDKVVELD